MDPDTPWRFGKVISGPCFCGQMRLSRRRKLALAVTLALAATGLGSAAVAAGGADDLGSKPVFVVRSDNTVDASVAGAAAARASAPLLYSSPESLDGTTRDYLARYQPTSVVLVGGTKALSETVEASVKTLGYKPLRVMGTDRAETAVKLGDLVASLPAAKGQKGDTGATGATGPAGVSVPRVRDGSSQMLGTFLGSNNGFIDVLTSTGYQINVPIDGPLPQDDARNGLYYTGPSCTGTAWFNTGFPGILYRTNLDARYSQSLGAWLQHKAMSQASMTAQSQWVYDGTVQTASCQSSSFSSSTGFELIVRSSAAVGVPTAIAYPLSIQQ